MRIRCDRPDRRGTIPGLNSGLNGEPLAGPSLASAAAVVPGHGHSRRRRTERNTPRRRAPASSLQNVHVRVWSHRRWQAQTAGTAERVVALRKRRPPFAAQVRLDISNSLCRGCDVADEGVFVPSWTRYLERCLRRSRGRTSSSVPLFDSLSHTGRLFGDMLTTQNPHQLSLLADGLQIRLAMCDSMARMIGRRIAPKWSI